MRIILFGASGRTGVHVIQQALDGGHTLTAFVRDPSKISITHPNLVLVEGDALNQNQVESAIKGQDVVISCLGVNTLRKDTRQEKMIFNIVEAMKKWKVQRIVYMASAGIENELKGPVGFIMKILLKNVLLHHRNAVEKIKSAGLSWTIVRPTGLTDGALQKSYKSSNTGIPSGKGKISRRDVAHFLLSASTDEKLIGTSIGITD